MLNGEFVRRAYAVPSAEANNWNGFHLCGIRFGLDLSSRRHRTHRRRLGSSKLIEVGHQFQRLRTCSSNTACRIFCLLFVLRIPDKIIVRTHSSVCRNHCPSLLKANDRTEVLDSEYLIHQILGPDEVLIADLHEARTTFTQAVPSPARAGHADNSSRNESQAPMCPGMPGPSPVLASGPHPCRPSRHADSQKAGNWSRT